MELSNLNGFLTIVPWNFPILMVICLIYCGMYEQFSEKSSTCWTRKAPTSDIVAKMTGRPGFLGLKTLNPQSLESDLPKINNLCGSSGLMWIQAADEARTSINMNWYVFFPRFGPGSSILSLRYFKFIVSELVYVGNQWKSPILMGCGKSTLICPSHF